MGIGHHDVQGGLIKWQVVVATVPEDNIGFLLSTAQNLLIINAGEQQVAVQLVGKGAGSGCAGTGGTARGTVAIEPDDGSGISRPSTYAYASADSVSNTSADGVLRAKPT